ncbi:MAG: rubrerythrin [Acidaminococcaceae bacterium]|nr:rubrerythrin [Acidaminococcaceae bacterium]
MSIYGKTKGTDLEKQIGQIATMEAMGGMMYYALARTAQDLGLEEVAKELMGLGIQEVNHAGFYATLNGKYPNNEKDFWKLVKGLSAAEYKGEETLNKIADVLRAKGLTEAADDVSYFALQEKHHGIKTQDMYEKYAPKDEAAPEKVYVCSVCGFVYEGDLDSEPTDYKCPLCGCAKGVFKLQ